jgi:hypothetical protein
VDGCTALRVSHAKKAGRDPIEMQKTAATQPAVAADRFAHEIVRFLAVCAALAAAERHSVGPPSDHAKYIRCLYLSFILLVPVALHYLEDAMLHLFNEQPSHATRALQIWQILIGKAANRQIMTYGMLAQMLGFRGAGTLAHPLGHIMYYCRATNLPPLTVLVVNQDTGIPGDGLLGDNLHADREAVFRYDWYGVIPPSPEDLRTVYQEHRAIPSTGDSSPA